MEVSGGLVYTKALWTVISGTHLRASCEVVEHELSRATVMICNGLTVFRSPSETASNKIKGKVGEHVYRFVNELGTFLGTESLQAWDLLSNYLMYEFQGSEVGLNAFLSSEKKKAMLMTDIWMFYHSERLFLLKCINLVLAYCTDMDHPYQEVLKKFMSKFDEEEFGNLLVLQLDATINEPYPHKDIRGVMMTDKYQIHWQNCNLREQIEVLHNIILHLEMHAMSPERMKKIVKLCIDSRFGKQKEYKLRNTALAMYYSQIIGYLQNILILHYTNYMCNCVLADDPCPIDLEDQMSTLGNQEEHFLLIMSWMLVKVFQDKSRPSSETMINLADLATNSNTFKYLQRLVLCDVFQANIKLSNFVFKTTYDFVNLFANNFELTTLSNVTGLLDLVGPLLRHKDIVDLFWKSENGIKSLFNILIKRFPAEFMPFMKAVHSLTLNAGEYLPEVMKILMNTQCFAVCVCDDLRRSAVNLNYEWTIEVEHRPMLWSNFILEPGTKGSMVQDDPLIASFKCGFSVFEAIMDKFQHLNYEIVTVVDDNISMSLVEDVEVSLQFLRDLLSTGVEMSERILTATNFAFVLINKLKSTKHYPTSIFALCFDVARILMPKQADETLKRLRYLDILPSVPYVPKNVNQLFDQEYFIPKCIGTIIVREECLVGKYPLLTSYLTFIYQMIKGGTDLYPEPYYMQVVVPGIVFILGDVYPSYQSWHFVEESEHDMIAITCIKVIHELLHVCSVDQDSPEVPSCVCMVQNLVLYSLLNMRSGKMLLKTVSSGGIVLQSKMEKKLNWVSGETNFTNILQLSLSILNRVLLLKSTVQGRSSSSVLEKEIYCSPKDNFKIIPTVASYVNNNFSNALPVLAVKVLRRFALDLPKTLLACLGIEGDYLREMIFRRLNSKIDCVRLKVALLQLVSACVDTQPGMCDAFFNLPHETLCSFGNDKFDPDEEFSEKMQKPDFLKTMPARDNTKGGILVYVCAVIAVVDKEPDVIATAVYAAAVELLCYLWLGENFAAIRYLREKEDFWKKLCTPLFQRPRKYIYAYAQIFTVITLEVFHHGKDSHPDVLEILEKFFNEENKFFVHWAQFVSEMCVCPKISEEVPDDSLNTYQKLAGESWDKVISMEERDEKMLLPSQKMEKQPPNVQLIISWKRFFITTLKLLPFKIGLDQKIFLTMTHLKALEHEIPKMTLKPILLLIELYIILVTDWRKQFVEDQGEVNNQLVTMLKTFTGTYIQSPCRLREAFLAFALLAVDCLADKMRKDEVTADTMLKMAKDIVLYELTDVGVSDDKTKLSKDRGDRDDEGGSNIIPSLVRVLIPGLPVYNQSLKGSLSGKIGLLFLHKVLKTVILETEWLNAHHITETRNAIIVSIGKILDNIHKSFPPMSMLQFSVVNSAMNLVYYMIDNEIADEGLDYKLPSNLWHQLRPPRDGETHWLSTDWPKIYKPALEMITRQLEARTFLFLPSVIDFVSIHRRWIVHAMLAFRHNMTQDMLELSIIAANFVRVLCSYPNHWRLANESSLNCVMIGVMTCLHMCVALLIHPLMLRSLIDKSEKEKKVEESQQNVSARDRMTTTHKQLLKLAFLSLSCLQPHCPRLSYLLTECVISPFTSKPVLEPHLGSPMYDRVSSVAVTFGTVITLAHLCTQALSKVARSPTSHPLMNSLRGSGAGSSLLMSMDKTLTTAVLEVTVEMITCQGLIYLYGNTLSSAEKELFRRSLNTEMTFFIEFTKRSVREEISSVTLEAVLDVMKSQLSSKFDLPMTKSPQDEKKLTPTKQRKLQLRLTPPKSKLGGSIYSPSSSSSPPSSRPSSSGSPPAESSSSEDFGYSSLAKSPENHFRLSSSEKFLKLVAHVFSSIFDIFA